METSIGRLGNTLKFFKIFLLLLVLLTGIIAGLYMGGGMYMIADRIVPWVERVPLIGRKVYPLLEKISPPVTAYERRLLELEEKEKYLLEKSKALEEERASLEKEKNKIRTSKTLLDEKAATPDKIKGKKTQSEEAPVFFGLISESFAEMPSSKAARIISLLPLEEAASLLEVMDPEQRSQVLGKMNPESAAKLVRFARIKTEKT